MRVLMTANLRGSKDGIDVQWYKKGQVYDLPDGLARALIDRKAAVPAPEAKQAVGPTSNK